MLVFLKKDITRICKMVIGPTHNDEIKWMLDPRHYSFLLFILDILQNIKKILQIRTMIGVYIYVFQF
jgi:hypothetical protein